MEIDRKSLKSLVKIILLCFTSHKACRNFIISLAEYIPQSKKFISRLPIPNHVQSFLLVRGKKILFTSPQRCSFSKQLYWDKGKIFPLQDRMTLEIFLRISGLCSNAFDIGCNTCQFSVCACTLNKKLRAFAFDILPEAVSISNNNALLNGISPQRLIVENIGLADAFSSKSAPISTYSPSLMSAYALDASISGDNPNEVLDIKVITLDHYVDQMRIKNLSGLSVFKIDVEGFESNVLKGSNITIQTLQPFIICEIRDKSNPEKVEAALKGHGYKYFLITDIGLLHSGQVYCHKKFRDWLFVPNNNGKEREILNHLFKSKCESEKEHNIQFKYLKS